MQRAAEEGTDERITSVHVRWRIRSVERPSSGSSYIIICVGRTQTTTFAQSTHFSLLAEIIYLRRTSQSRRPTMVACCNPDPTGGIWLWISRIICRRGGILMEQSQHNMSMCSSLRSFVNERATARAVSRPAAESKPLMSADSNLQISDACTPISPIGSVSAC